jgi:outer membrane receptor protein involved in Fe transport
MKSTLTLRATRRPIALAAAACLLPAFALAQQSAPAPKAETGLNLETVVITGTSQRSSKMAASVSVSSLGSEELTQSGALSATEVLRSIPGIHAESSGGESNANVTVRGLPISAGGSRYVQFQEDGLPVLQFGDIAFATPDTWLRIDNATDRLEVVRGGSASTLATGAPGGIINFISKTGSLSGGVASMTLGLGGYDQKRYEFGYGGALAPKTTYYVGGHYRMGDGARQGDVPIEAGGQFRANITQKLDNGFVRLYLKHLDDRAPTLLPVPVKYANGQILQVPGIDPRKASGYSPYWVNDVTLTGDNGKVGSNVNNGLTAKSDAIGAEVELDLAGGWKLQEKFRVSKNSGRFIGVFPGSDVTVAAPGTTYATGPNAGQAFSGNAYTAVVFNTSLDNLGLTANDLKVSKSFALGGDAKLQTTAGLYTSQQKLGVTWSFNQYTLEATGNKPALLNQTGTTNGTAAFGGCCQNFQDSTYTTTAPYLVLGYDQGPLTLEGSIRHDDQKASGQYRRTGEDGGTAGVAYNLASTRTIDYSVKHTSYSLGGNYRLTKDLAVFARYSDGAAFNADRITFFNQANLVNGKSSVIPVNTVKQTELGTKWRQGGFSTFATLFMAKTTESNVDTTTTPITKTDSTYDAKGLELESSYRIGGFAISGGATFTDAKLTASTNAALVGQTPKRLAKVIYQVSPTYSMGNLTLGASLVGTTSSKDDSPTGPLTVTLPGYSVLNGFVNYAVNDKATVSFGVNNLTNTIGYTESNDGRGAARSINGRTMKVTLSYEL